MSLLTSIDTSREGDRTSDSGDPRVTLKPFANPGTADGGTVRQQNSALPVGHSMMIVDHTVRHTVNI